MYLADTSSIEAFKELINKFTNKGYNPKHYENPRKYLCLLIYIEMIILFM